MPVATDRGRVPAVVRAAAVLQAVSTAGRPVGLAELTLAVGAPKSSVMGVCHALTEERLLTRGADGSYILGPRVLEFGSAARAQHQSLRSIGFSYPIDEPFFRAEIKALREETSRIGATADIRSAELDTARQVSDVARFIADGVDLVLVEPVTSDGLQEVFATARAARIPVVAVGSATIGADAVAATDNTKAGALAGAALVRVLGAEGRIAIVGGTPITANADRVAGFLSVISANPGLRVVVTRYAGLDEISGERAALELLEEGAEFDGMFASNDQIALGAAGVLAAAGRAVPIVSVDGGRMAIDQILAGGPLAATAAQDPGGLVRAGLELGAALYGGLGVGRRSVYLPPRLIDTLNVGDYQPWG
ncbi:substrate-binding domain-containing protein [Nakamurella alba]|nr:substrate-binding domain-containing protein [Nakamurella alba]